MFKLPDNIIEGIKEYKNSLGEFLDGKINYSRFTAIRVPWGIYSHRGREAYMSRIRIPAGLISPDQLKAIAHVASTYGNGISHITTRQDIQVHGIKIEDTIKVIEYLKDYGLSPRGGGGNTVRNITACSRSGICENGILNVRNYAVSLSEYLLSLDDSYNLPRKFKIAFSGCGKDCAGCLVNDVGLLAEENGGEKGFKVFAGGGMGKESRVGRLLEEFIPEGELGYCVLALKNVFYKNGDRRNKHHNRLRFLIEDIGFDKFKKLYDDELKAIKESEYINLRKIELSYPEFSEEPYPDVKDEEFQGFLKYNVKAQKQNGLASIELRIPRGDILPDKLRALADLGKEFKGIEFRTSQRQNILLCNIRKSEVHQAFLKVKKILDGFLYPKTLLDIVCCKGALTCNLGLCNSPGLTEEVERALNGHFTGSPVFKKLNIKINGCQNSCGQHPIGLIGLHGIVRKVSARSVPFYKLLLGGRRSLLDTRLAKDTGILIPARNAPLFLKDFIGRINNDIDKDTDIYKYIDDEGLNLAKEASVKYSYVPSYEENRDFYIDWGKSEDFSLEGLGPGECGAGVLDMIDADLTDADIALDKAKSNDYSIQDIKQALFLSARALLVVKGSDPRDGQKACFDFAEKFVKEGIAPDKFLGLVEFFAGLKEGLTLKEKEDRFLYVKEFFETVKGIYKSMDPGFNFPKQKPVDTKEQEEKVSFLDLKGVRCP
ncbi:MAG: nitrite/sulfite reductase, partial [Candidatus Omnitrophica bacterium]|nr:nitrite/sulfite reductase [Candidatus Omnitrophota bacterium]